MTSENCSGPKYIAVIDTGQRCQSGRFGCHDRGGGGCIFGWGCRNRRKPLGGPIGECRHRKSPNRPKPTGRNPFLFQNVLSWDPQTSAGMSTTDILILLRLGVVSNILGPVVCILENHCCPPGMNDRVTAVVFTHRNLVVQAEQKTACHYNFTWLTHPIHRSSFLNEFQCRCFMFLFAFVPGTAGNPTPRRWELPWKGF